MQEAKRKADKEYPTKIMCTLTQQQCDLNAEHVKEQDLQKRCSTCDRYIKETRKD